MTFVKAADGEEVCCLDNMRVEKEVGDFSPHLKKVLKSYTAAASNSLKGPNNFFAPSIQMSSSNSEIEDTEPFVLPPPFPIQQPPIFTPSDQSICQWTETILEDEVIMCFLIGGEQRLCLPQILNTVLRDFSLHEINKICNELQIFCSRCNEKQLEALKMKGILPFPAPSCGLITKTDAERLCAALLINKNPPKSQNSTHSGRMCVRVYHKCFGKCTGYWFTELYTSPTIPCIECCECRGLFSPQKFVCHSHRVKENRICHWGFDSTNWRSYLLLNANEEDEYHQRCFEELKAKFHDETVKRKQMIEENNISKRLCLESSSHLPLFPFHWGTEFTCWYHAASPWNQSSAFKPTMAENKTIPYSFFHQLRSSSHHFTQGFPFFQHHYAPFSNNRMEWQCRMSSEPVISKTRNMPSFVPALVPSDKNIVSHSEEKPKIKIIDRSCEEIGVSDKANIKCDLEELQSLLNQHNIEEEVQKKIISKVKAICLKSEKRTYGQHKHLKETSRTCKKDYYKKEHSHRQENNSLTQSKNQVEIQEDNLEIWNDSQAQKNTKKDSYEELLKQKAVLQQQVQCLQQEIEQLKQLMVPKMPSTNEQSDKGQVCDM